MEKELQLLTPLASDESVSREDFLKAIIASGILANPNIDPKSWGVFEKISSAGLRHLSCFERSVDRAYKILFEELSHEDSVINEFSHENSAIVEDEEDEEDEIIEPF